MSSFTADQVGQLGKRLSRQNVEQRQVEGKTIDYIEGWFAISEANAIFGFDGWDRETVHFERLFERTRGEATSCAYVARVRIRVRAGDQVVVREGTGISHAQASTPGDAHERALKSAETDATKRALATFGNRFGLGLYDKDQHGVTGKRREQGLTYTVFGPDGLPVIADLSAESFCTALRQIVEKSETVEELVSLQRRNKTGLSTLRTKASALRNAKGIHYADILEQMIAERTAHLSQKTNAKPEGLLPPSRITGGPRVDKAALTIGTERRLRDKGHLQFVARHPCLVCGREHAQAHHLKFAQKRGLALKVSDEFTVPLCAAHHDELHRASDERQWWEERHIGPLSIAADLWTRSRNGDLPPMERGHTLSDGDPLEGRNTATDVRGSTPIAPVPVVVA